MVLFRRDGAGVTIAIGAIRIVGFVEIEHQFIVDNVFDAQIKVAATAIGTFPIAQILERYEEVIPVLWQSIAQTAIDAKLMFHSTQLEFCDSITDIRAGDPTIGWQLKWLSIGCKVELAVHKITFISGKKLHIFKVLFVQRRTWVVFKCTQVGFAVLGNGLEVHWVGLPNHLEPPNTTKQY